MITTTSRWNADVGTCTTTDLKLCDALNYVGILFNVGHNSITGGIVLAAALQSRESRL